MTLDELRECKDPLYLGGDIARVKDFTVFWLIRAVGGVRLTVHRVALRNMPFDEQERVLYELLELPTFRRACIDNSGLGRQLIERAQKRFGAYKVEPVTFTLAIKEELAYPLQGSIRRSHRQNPGRSKNHRLTSRCAERNNRQRERSLCGGIDRSRTR